MTVAEVLTQTDLNWTVRKEGLISQSGIIIPDKCAIIREDTQDVLGVHGSGYEPYQNEELIELLFQISNKTGMEVHTGGQYHNGAKIFIQLKSDDLILPGDLVKGYVTGVNSFDGSTSLGFGNSTLTISCMNTFHKAYKNLRAKVKHTSSLKARVDEILMEINKAVKEEQMDFATIKRMTEHEINAPQIQEEIITSIFNLDVKQKFEELSTRKQNQITNFKSAWDIETKQKGNTAWGAMSAMTRYTTHNVYKDKVIADRNKLFGLSRERDNKVWKKLSKLVPA